MEADITSQAVGLASNTDFSIIKLFTRADFIVKSVIIILIASSIYSWAIIFEKIKSMDKPNKIKTRYINTLNEAYENLTDYHLRRKLDDYLENKNSLSIFDNFPFSGKQILPNFDFKIPIGKNGDCYDRYLCRMEEMRESVKIIKDCIEKMPAGPVRTIDGKISPPKKEDLKNSMEALIHHFKLFSEGFRVPELSLIHI